MSILVNDQDMYDYLDIESTDDPNGVVLGIRDAVEQMLAAETGQDFGPAATIVREQRDGNDMYIMYSRRNILTLDKIEFLFLPDVTQELYFNLDILNYVTYQVGRRRIHSRTYKFPIGLNNVLLSYHTPDNIPLMGVLAVKDVVAMIWRSRGSEDARSEQKGTFQHAMVRSIDESKMWQKAVPLLLLPTLG